MCIANPHICLSPWIYTIYTHIYIYLYPPFYLSSTKSCLKLTWFPNMSRRMWWTFNHSLVIVATVLSVPTVLFWLKLALASSQVVFHCYHASNDISSDKQLFAMFFFASWAKSGDVNCTSNAMNIVEFRALSPDSALCAVLRQLSVLQSDTFVPATEASMPSACFKRYR